MKEFSEYEERMISFLMGHGMSEELAEQSVIDERIDRFNDANHQLTDENQKRNLPPIQVRIPHDPLKYQKIAAFRAEIGEYMWRLLGGDMVNTELLARAIDYKYEK